MNEQFFSHIFSLATKNNQIESSLYSKFNVKRGLRNSDGTGVLVGLTNIGDVHSYIIDEGEKVPIDGILRYRGIDVRQFVNGFTSQGRFGYEECVFLLLFGKLPTQSELSDFCALLGEFRALPLRFTEDMILKAPSRNIMNKMARAVLASYSYDDEPDNDSLDNILLQCIMNIARFPSMAAYGFQAKAHYHDNKSLFLHSPDPELGTAENLLRLIRPDKCYTKQEAEMLDLALVLHAEHGGGNNSTFAVHLITSTATDVYSALAAGLGSLKGPLHGGANSKVLQMMDDIKTNVKDWSNRAEVESYLEKIINKQAFDGTGLIYGMGHAVYTVSDPRTAMLKEKAISLAKEKGAEREKELNLYMLIEELVPDVFYKIKKNDKVICANVDFYSGFVYRMLDIPEELYTPLFAVARVAGWCAHLIEERINGGRIIRPAYKSVIGKQEYSEISERDL